RRRTSRGRGASRRRRAFEEDEAVAGEQRVPRRRVHNPVRLGDQLVELEEELLLEVGRMEDDMGSALDLAHVLQTVGTARGDVMEIAGPETSRLLSLHSLRVRLELSLTDQNGFLCRMTVEEGRAGPRGKDVFHQGVRALRFAAGESNEHGHAHDMKGSFGRALRRRVAEGRHPGRWGPSAK